MCSILDLLSPLKWSFIFIFNAFLTACGTLLQYYVATKILLELSGEIVMYSALAEPAMEGGEPCIRILLIAYAVYGLSQYCIRTTSDLAHPLLDFTSDYLGEFSQLYLAR